MRRTSAYRDWLRARYKSYALGEDSYAIPQRVRRSGPAFEKLGNWVPEANRNGVVSGPSETVYALARAFAASEPSASAMLSPTRPHPRLMGSDLVFSWISPRIEAVCGTPSEGTS